MTTAGIVEIIKETPQAFDKVYLDTLEGWICSHNAGTYKVQHHESRLGEYTHTSEYCNRCNELVGQEF